jgi:outer membrane biosynthesis protein TonB
MREGGIFSGIFHLVVLVLVLVGLPHFHVAPPDPEPVSTVEVVTLAPKATAPELPKPPAPKPPEPPKPVEVKPPPPSPPPAAPPTPAPPKAEVIPDKKVEAPKPPPKKEEPKKEPPKPKPDPFDSILKNLTKNQPPPTKEPPKPQQQAVLPPPPVQGAATLSPQLARSEMDAIRDHIRPCWNFPAGAKNAEELFVLIDVQMNPDATVREARISSSSQLSDPYYRSAAESALRAVLNCGRQPLPLSPEKYNTWKSMTLRFDPRDL